MNKFYVDFLDAIQRGPVQRRTIFKTGAESIYQDGRLVCGSEITTPDLTENITLEPHLVLFGCGHVGKALYDLAVLQGMRVTIFDSRAELLTAQRFPLATRIVGPYDETLSKDYPSFVSPYYCIFTHGHNHDQECLLYALHRKHSYIGMIGSRAKVDHCLQNIKAMGITEPMLSKLHSPIGLPINAVTPQEIAISIMAEIISTFRRDKTTITIDPSLLAQAAANDGVMVRIVQKQGSVPQSIGSMLYVTPTAIYGTVGGGALENHAINQARTMLLHLQSSTTHILEHHTLTESQQLSMTCGGNTTLLYKVYLSTTH